jgi:hypothetical protein
MNSTSLFKTESNVLTRDQVADLARRAGLTADDLKNPSPKVVKDLAHERHIERPDGNIVRVYKLGDGKIGACYEVLPSGEARLRVTSMASGNGKPDDEPIMIFRAQDRYAITAIETYARIVTSDGNAVDPRTADSAQACFMAFQAFANEHPERMKIPD